MDTLESYKADRFIERGINRTNNRVSVHYFSSSDVDIFYYQVCRAISQYKNLVVNETPVKLSLFTECIDAEDYNTKQLIIKEIRNSENIDLPIALIAQAPLSGLVCLEVFTLETDEKLQIEKGRNYQIIKTNNEEYLFSSLNFCGNNTFLENTIACFDELDAVLKKTNFNYSDIIRQWNYIENILDAKVTSEKLSQNYQNFNDIRSEYYHSDTFKNGYPAATGIGASTGGCTIEIIAQKGKSNNIQPIKNTRQIDAHIYSGKVLVGEGLKETVGKTTPKFERAKIAESDLSKLLLISGTASIIGEKTVFENDVVGQTRTTIDNINLLVDEAKLKTNNEKVSLTNYRVYIKNKEDYSTVKNICKELLGNFPVIYLLADVCRNNLLVEIECNYNL